MVLFIVQTILVLATVFAAFRWGSRSHRMVASILFAVLVVNAAYDVFIDDNPIYLEFPYLRAFLDCLALAAIYVLAFNTNGWWVLWVGSAQNLSVAAHLLRALDVELNPLVHAVLDQWPFWIEILITAYAIARAKYQPKTRTSY